MFWADKYPTQHEDLLLLIHTGPWLILEINQLNMNSEGDYHINSQLSSK